MPIVESVIEFNRLQRNGRRLVREAHTDHTGQTHRVMHRVSGAADVQAEMLARVPVIEGKARRAELQRIEQLMLGGSTVAQVQARKAWNTNAQIGEYLFKRMANRLRSVDRHSLENDLPALFLLRTLFAEVTDAQVAALLSVPQQDVSDWRASFETMLAGITQYGHDLPEFGEVL